VEIDAMTLELGGFDPQATYSAAAEDYERASQRFWQFLSTRTVERLILQPGQAVLDAACGTAPGTIAAARAVAPGGRVVGVDYAHGMLAVAHRNVAESGVQGVELVQGDVLNMPYRAEFDAVMCVLGIFFIEDMAAAARSLWSHVRPGGTLAVTTFTHDVWTPMLDRFLDAAGRARPDIERVVPWRRADDPDVLARALRDGGVSGVRIEEETVDISFSPDEWPTIVMGSGLRRIALDLGEQVAAVLSDNDRWARAHRVTSVRVGANYASARKP
jgi:ubiquinone/menaquinone biosynthesis C-methylase UbiE